MSSSLQGKSEAHGSVGGNDSESGVMRMGTVIKTSLAHGLWPVDSCLSIREMGLVVKIKKLGDFGNASDILRKIGPVPF